MSEGKHPESVQVEEDQVEIESEVVDSEGDLDGDNTEVAKEGESVQESVKKVVSALKAEENEAASDGGEAPEEEKHPGKLKADIKGEDKPLEKGKKARKKEVIPDLGARGVSAPHGLQPHEQKIFNELPNQLKPAAARLFNEMRGSYSRTQAELQKVTQENRHILEAVRPYYTSVPALAEAGITEGQFIAKLVANHQALMDPKRSKAKLAGIAQSLGHNIKFVDENGEEVQESPSQFRVENDPKFQALQKRLDEVYNLTQKQLIERESAPIVAEVAKLQQEFPELRDREFLLSVRQLVSGMVGKHPTAENYARALRLVVMDHRERNGENPYQSNQTKPRQQIQRPIAPSRTVRGGVTPPSSSSIETNGARPGELMSESVRAAIESLKRGVMN